jgi:hypothetical protein
MKKPEMNTTATINAQLMKLEVDLRQLLNQLSPNERLTFLNGMIARMYNTSKTPVSAPERIRLVVAQRKGSTLSSDQQDQLKKLSDLTNQLYDLENGNND